jgi:hypothetical protein
MSLYKDGRKSGPFQDLHDGFAQSAGSFAAKLCREGYKTEAYQKVNLDFEEEEEKRERERRARWDAKTYALLCT